MHHIATTTKITAHMTNDAAKRPMISGIAAAKSDTHTIDTAIADTVPITSVN